MFRRFSTSEHVKVIWLKLTKYGRGCSAGTGGHPESGTPSKVWSWALVCWSTAISKSSFTKKSGCGFSNEDRERDILDQVVFRTNNPVLREKALSENLVLAELAKKGLGIESSAQLALQ